MLIPDISVVDMDYKISRVTSTVANDLKYEWRGTGGVRIQEERGGREGCRRQEKRGFQCGGNWEELRKILQHCIIICNRNNTNR